MNTGRKLNIFGVGSYIAIVLFTAFSCVWLMLFSRFHIIGRHEEMQLFRSDIFYFKSYMALPGGIGAYAASFLTQLYHYPLVGALILSVSITAVYLLFMAAGRKFGAIDKFFVIPFVLPVLLLMSVADTNVRLSHILGIIIVLIFFILYIHIKGKARLWLAPILYLIAYVAAGGNVLLLTALIAVNELFEKKRSNLLISGMLLLALVVPFLFQQFIYVVLPKTAYLSLTPFATADVNKTYAMAWCAVPILYLIWRLIPVSMTKIAGNEKSWIWVAACWLVISGFTGWGVGKTKDRGAELIAKMAYHAEHADWEKILDMAEKDNSDYDEISACYFTNMALWQLGKLPEKMFDYRQIGTAGLFLTWEPNYRNRIYTGEFYYRMGVIPEAEHCAFDAMVNNPVEHGSKSIRRLVLTNMLRGDSINFYKYANLMEKSPVYRKWAQEQKRCFEALQIDSLLEIPGVPKAAQFPDFFINYDMPEYNLIRVQRANVHEKKPFEYLMASVMLQKDLNMLLSCLENFYADLHYAEMPRLWQEALLVCVTASEEMEQRVLKFPVGRQVIADFNVYNEILRNGGAQKEKQLEERFGNTYWHYYQYVKKSLPMRKAKPVNWY